MSGEWFAFPVRIKCFLGNLFVLSKRKKDLFAIICFKKITLYDQLSKIRSYFLVPDPAVSSVSSSWQRWAPLSSLPPWCPSTGRLLYFSTKIFEHGRCLLVHLHIRHPLLSGSGCPGQIIPYCQRPCIFPSSAPYRCPIHMCSLAGFWYRWAPSYWYQESLFLSISRCICCIFCCFFLIQFIFAAFLPSHFS